MDILASFELGICKTKNGMGRSQMTLMPSNPTKGLGNSMEASANVYLMRVEVALYRLERTFVRVSSDRIL